MKKANVYQILLSYMAIWALPGLITLATGNFPISGLISALYYLFGFVPVILASIIAIVALLANKQKQPWLIAGYFTFLVLGICWLAMVLSLPSEM